MFGYHLLEDILKVKPTKVSKGCLKSTFQNREHNAQSKKKDVLVIFTLQETNEFQFIWQKLYSRERPIAYAT